MTDEKTNHTCPYCKEDIKYEAIKCKHCGSRINSDVPTHKGTCPYCKEEIKPEAIKCKHCYSILLETKQKCCEQRHIQTNQKGPSRWKCFPLPLGGQFCILESTGDVVILE